MDLPHQPTLLSRIVFAILLWFYRRGKWTAFGGPPPGGKGVILAVPHVTNWDFVNYMGLTHDLGVRTRFMAKDSLFKWPMGRFMRDMGGIPVDRTRKANLVEQMAEQFAQRDELLLTIAPEGSRGATGAWKTGFYHIAHRAGVPIVCGLIDYENRTGGLGPAIETTGDFLADMQKVRAFYVERGVSVPDFEAIAAKMKPVEPPL